MKLCARRQQLFISALVVEMANEPPEIRFDAISHSTGFETIEKARRSLQNEERSCLTVAALKMDLRP